MTKMTRKCKTEKIDVAEGFFNDKYLNIMESQTFDPLSCLYKPVAKIQGPSHGEQWDGLRHFF